MRRTHPMLAKSHRAVARISSTVRGGRHALSQVPGLSFRGRRPQARNGCAVPGRLAEPYIKFSLSSIAVDDPTTECATARLIVWRSMDGRASSTTSSENGRDERTVCWPQDTQNGPASKLHRRDRLEVCRSDKYRLASNATSEFRSNLHPPGPHLPPPITRSICLPSPVSSNGLFRCSSSCSHRDHPARFRSCSFVASATGIDPSRGLSHRHSRENRRLLVSSHIEMRLPSLPISATSSSPLQGLSVPLPSLSRLDASSPSFLPRLISSRRGYTPFIHCLLFFSAVVDVIVVIVDANVFHRTSKCSC
ncbi:hypothetical protein PRIPAC_89687, partial [Pristionchus pacificus]|uniref:Uncharacterized protein n=1 Tax=Pristionchus pacificus TaxID=54126 RepID=A0A2A6B9P6_PRIPA